MQLISDNNYKESSTELELHHYKKALSTLSVITGVGHLKSYILDLPMKFVYQFLTQTECIPLVFD